MRRDSVSWNFLLPYIKVMARRTTFIINEVKFGESERRVNVNKSGSMHRHIMLDIAI